MIKAQGQIIKRISVSDPTRKLDKIRLTVSFKADKPGNNFTVSWNESKKESEISIGLPKDVYAGESVTIDI
jgi:chondroitin AC lyase